MYDCLALLSVGQAPSPIELTKKTSVWGLHLTGVSGYGEAPAFRHGLL